MKKIIFLLSAVVFFSCSPKNTLDFEDYNFEIKGFDWDKNPYKFSRIIQDSVLEAGGSQYAAWDFSYIGNIEKMLITWDGSNGARGDLKEEELSEFKKYRPQAAIPFILKKSREYDVVIINEAHQMPQHRVFTTRLLQGLYDNGYRYFGLETIFSSPKNDSTLHANGYPFLNNGFYIKEPQFGNLVREALKIGFTVFGYESRGHENSMGREINQSNNIKTFIETHPKHKVLIHCGFAHGYEGVYGGSWEKAMAARLSDLMGIDPLTINQTSYSEKSKRELEAPTYKTVNLEEHTVFVNEEGKVFGKYRENCWFDVSIFHPRSKSFNRPQWLIYGDRQEVPIDLSEVKLEFPCLVFAYKSGEEIGRAVPYDLQEAQDQNDSVKLVLEKGDFEIIVWDQNKKAVKASWKVE